ncbi:hypothetical protein L9F63_011064 [Diploptera punctata]|uniref:Fe2OG dioxygenase domain-containing protein n=1 Tax=Diploptera punctata TaxID=6984 RepID=A0AAD8EPW3_DIPPU|nr:hypothetical protein L9F63_011064 [Diploptera punctata]
MDSINNLITKAPPTVYYIPNFITEEEEKRIIDQVNGAPKPKWTQLSHRRLQNWGGIPHPRGMIWLTVFTERVGKLNLFGGKQPNHVLVNEYLPGQGIMPHLDGPLFYPTVTTISCGSNAKLEFFEPRADNDNSSHFEESAQQIASLLLERRSLVVLQDDMYTKYLHSIAEVHSDTIQGTEANLQQCGIHYEVGTVLQRGTRISLTIRHVPHTSKLQIRLGR